MDERYEFKYFVDERHIPTIRQTALAVGGRDSHAGPDGTYVIRSLYLDTRDLLLYEANDREAHDRFKVRVRSYPSATSPYGNAPVFLEIKRRTGDVIRKSRAPVSPHVWQAITRGDAAALQALPSRSRPAAEKFMEKVLHYHLEPAELVQYTREAFASKIDIYARVTLDTRIAGQPPIGLTLEANDRRWRPVDGPRLIGATVHSVLELKFQHEPPRWMSAMVKRLDLYRFSFSKYGYSIESERTVDMSLRTPTIARGSA